MGKAKNSHNLGAASYFIVPLLLLLAVSFDVLGAEAAQTAETAKTEEPDLFAMSLEQLMDVGVYAAATITEKDPLKTPACVTYITAEDIARTPARNILDLMEIYVPGMLYMNHSIGPVMGMRNNHRQALQVSGQRQWYECQYQIALWRPSGAIELGIERHRPH